MLGKCFFVLCLVSVVCAFFTGNVAELSQAVFDGCRDSVELCLSLLGMMCLWCGVIEVFRDAGALRFLSRLTAPLLRHIFPDCADDEELMGDITSSVTANMLGVASAATPYALRAMEKLDKLYGGDSAAGDDMVTLALLGCSSISLFPTTVVTLMYSAGSKSPYSILVPVWICSAVCTAFSLVTSRLTARNRKRSNVPNTSKIRKDIPNGNAVVSRGSRAPRRGRASHGVGEELL